MQIDPQSLRRHYASLADEELIALDRTELTAVAQQCYDEEFARRELTLPPGDESRPGPDDDTTLEGDGGDVRDVFVAGEEPNWLNEAGCVCSFSTIPKQTATADADNALAVLRAAGIPCEVEVHEIEPSSNDPGTQSEYRIMVPGALNLQAASVLDKEIFNLEMEAEWRTHFAALSDEELRALHADVICAGLLDRIQRLTRAYNDESARRREKLG